MASIAGMAGIAALAKRHAGIAGSSRIGDRPWFLHASLSQGVDPHIGAGEIQWNRRPRPDRVREASHAGRALDAAERIL